MSPTGRNKDIISLEFEFLLGAETSRVFSIINDIAQWPNDLDARLLKSQPNTKVIAGLPDFSRPEFVISANETGSLVELHHDLIKTDEDKKLYRKIWKAWFKQVEKRLSI
jgi:hypothetical protein